MNTTSKLQIFLNHLLQPSIVAHLHKKPWFDANDFCAMIHRFRKETDSFGALSVCQPTDQDNPSRPKRDRPAFLPLLYRRAELRCISVLIRKTIQRARAGQFCPAIKRAEMAREAMYRQRTWDGAEGWQGAAWNLERKYPTQYSKPEIQLAVNTTNNTVNNTLVVTAEVAGANAERVQPIEAQDR